VGNYLVLFFCNVFCILWIAFAIKDPTSSSSPEGKENAAVREEEKVEFVNFY
jgi:hypothetical protein